MIPSRRFQWLCVSILAAVTALAAQAADILRVIVPIIKGSIITVEPFACGRMDDHDNDRTDKGSA